jgi:hypothetical protein
MEIRFKKRQMACMKRIWDHRAWDLGLAEEPLLERSEESLEETNSTEASSEDEGCKVTTKTRTKGPRRRMGPREGARRIEEDETEANENEAEDPTWTGPKDDELGGAVSELLEFLFEPNIMFIADEFTNGQPFSNLLF